MEANQSTSAVENNCFQASATAKQMDKSTAHLQTAQQAQTKAKMPTIEFSLSNFLSECFDPIEAKESSKPKSMAKRMTLSCFSIFAIVKKLL